MFFDANAKKNLHDSGTSCMLLEWSPMTVTERKGRTTMTYQTYYSAASQSLEADVADALIALDCAEIDRLETHDVVAAQAADGTLDCEWSDRDIATMLRDAGTSDTDAAIAKVRRIYVRRMVCEFSEVAS